jgi:hypothetical protein
VLVESSGLRIVTPNGDTVLERVEAAHPSASDLAAFAGEYASSETGSTVAVAEKNGELTLTIAAGKPVHLRPTFHDAFMMEGSPTSILFRRDASGKVTGLSAGDDRVWDLRFTRSGSGTQPSRAR